jgi:cysteine-rich repeat protein
MLDKALVALSLSLLHTGSAAATTFVRMEVSDLTRLSHAVVLGRVRAASGTASPGGAIHIRVTVDVEEALKGSVASGSLTLREPGGLVGDTELVVEGAPRLALGERALLFLRAGEDGSLHVTHQAMGKFAVPPARPGEAEVAVRDFGGARVLRADLQPAPQREVRPLAELLLEIRGLVTQQRDGQDTAPPLAASGEEARADGTVAEAEAFVLSSPPRRWFEPDVGTPVGFGIEAGGDVNLGPAASIAVVEAGLAAWTQVLTAGITLLNAGAGPASPVGACDGETVVTFNDPFGEIDPPAGCAGTLGLGGGCRSTSITTDVNGVTFYKMTEGNVVFADGFAPECAFNDPCNFAEVAAHELGHAIGFGHSSHPDATMRATAHFDGRCAMLHADDAAAATFVYPFGAECPNGELDPGEGCDDGNTAAGDGCGPACAVETCFACAGEPSSCTPITSCGDGDGCCAPGCTFAEDDDCTTNVRGAAFLVKDPKPPGDPTGADPARRLVKVLAVERSSPDTVSGDPIAGGATIQLVAGGAFPSSQTIVVPPGAKPPGAAHGWSAIGGGFKWVNPTATGTAGIALKVLVVKKSPAGTVTVKALLKGGLGTLDVAPPRPGTSGGMILTLGGAVNPYCVRFGGPAGGRVVNSPSGGATPLAKVFKVVSSALQPTVEAGCPAP